MKQWELVVCATTLCHINHLELKLTVMSVWLWRYSQTDTALGGEGGKGRVHPVQYINLSQGQHKETNNRSQSHL